VSVPDELMEITDACDWCCCGIVLAPGAAAEFAREVSAVFVMVSGKCYSSADSMRLPFGLMETSCVAKFRLVSSMV
jgi:ribosomal protein L24E